MPFWCPGPAHTCPDARVGSSRVWVSANPLEELPFKDNVLG